MKKQESIITKLREIKACIVSYCKDCGYMSSGGGLMGGDYGILLYLYHYARTMNDEDAALVAQKVMELVAEKMSYMHSVAYCDGWAGILLYFDYLRENEFIDIDTDSIIDVVETKIVNYTTLCLSNSFFEFLYGVGGVGFYWLKRGNKQMVDYIISALYEAKEFDVRSGGYRWRMRNIKETECIDYNLSMSHGMVGMLMFVMRAFERYGNEKARDILWGGIAYLLSRRNMEPSLLSLFPSVADSDVARNSRLGWCYGDLGCAYLLYEAALVCLRDDWRSVALEIYRHASLRRSQEQSLVSDAGLCHGSAGLHMIFRDIAVKCQNAIFAECADFWVEETLRYSSFKDGLAGYKSLYIDTWYNDFSFLTGISGIGLSLLSAIDSDCKAADYFLLK